MPADKTDSGRVKPRLAYHGIQPPCRNCTHRQVGCHSKCKGYSEYKAKVEEKLQARRLEVLSSPYIRSDNANSKRG